MNNYNFTQINDDPTKDLDLSGVSLENQYSSLTEHEKILVFCKLNGYSKVPPSIERLYSDPYMLGGEKYFNGGSSLFDYWKGALHKIFPNEVLTAKPFLILGGAVGIGKSTISRLCLANTYSRLLCMKNPSKTLGLTPKPLSAVIFHKSEETANTEFRKWFYQALKESPYFRNTVNPNLKFNVLTSGPRGVGGLGSDVIQYIISEVNFYGPEIAKHVVSTALIRMTSRFSEDAITKVGNFILDSSAKDNQDISEWFLENSIPELSWNCKPTHYEVRTNLYEKSQGKTFKVYSGDAKYPPQILPEDYKTGDLDIDQDKILNVPIQLKTEFRTNLIKSLQDLCGISVGSSDSFFPGGIENVIKCSTLVNKIPEIITIDFYNKEERIRDVVDPMIKNLAPGRAVWLGLDLAINSDKTGIAAVTFEGFEDHDGTKMPKVKCWFLLAIKNKEGQEISLFHIQQLITDLSKEYRLIVSADQAYSKQLLQYCQMIGIKTNGRISTDIVPCEPAIFLKNLFNYGLIQVPVNKRFQREAFDLHYDKKGKVDHPKKASISPYFDNPDGKEIGSKDVWDSLASASYSLKLSIDEGEEYGYDSGYNKQGEIIRKLSMDSRLESQKIFQEMLENIW
jgi:hypothetical protein